MKPYDFVRNGIGYTFHALPNMTDVDVFSLYPETKPVIPAPTPTPVASGVKAVVTSIEPNTMNVQYTNNNAVQATLKIRVGSVDRPDRIVPAGKTVVSTYTTTVKTGFTGQKITVLHVETNTMILEQVL
jgi:outer membrane protein assembly factor BamA